MGRVPSEEGTSTFREAQEGGKQTLANWHVDQRDAQPNQPISVTCFPMSFTQLREGDRPPLGIED